MVADPDGQLRLRDLPAAAAAGRATSSTRGCRARRRSWPTTGSCCSRRSSSCSRRCSRRSARRSTGERLTVGPPFFNKWMLPIGLVLLFLTGVGPLLAWRKSTLDEPRATSSCGRSLAASWSRGRPAAGRRAVLGAPASASRCARSSSRPSSRSSCAARAVRRGRPGTDFLTALIGLVGAVEAPLRRLHRAPRHRADVPRLRRRGVQADEQVLLKPGAAGDGRPLHDPQRRAHA